VIVLSNYSDQSGRSVLGVRDLTWCWYRARVIIRQVSWWRGCCTPVYVSSHLFKQLFCIIKRITRNNRCDPTRVSLSASGCTTWQCMMCTRNIHEKCPVQPVTLIWLQ